MSGITTVIFDIGNVLYQWDPRHLYARLIPDPERLDWFLANVVTQEWHFQHDAGRDLAPMVAELIAEHPDQAELIAHYVPRWLETIPGPVPGSIEIVEDLAARGVPLYAITNFGTEFWAMFRSTAPVFDRFNDVVVSGAERLVKPDRAIFERAVQRFGIRPGEAIFIDDRLENVRAAEAFGMRGHHFQNAPRLRAELERLGLLA